MKIITTSRFCIVLFFGILYVLSTQNVIAQIPAYLTLSSPTSGTYYATKRITLAPGFRTTGPFKAIIVPGGEQTLVSKPSLDQNYLIMNVIKKSGITTKGQLAELTVSEINQKVQYVDGLGRNSQTIMVQASPNFGDIITPVEYDVTGRETSKFLSYTANSTGGSYRNDAVSSLTAFYNSVQPGLTSTTFPYSKSVFELSSLNRVVEQGAPGAVWQPASNGTGHTVKTLYGTNNSSDLSVRLYRAIAVSTSGHEYERSLNTAGLYANNQLSLTIYKDENWVSSDGKAGTTEEYKDEKDQIVLKRTFNMVGSSLQILSTYYVYDDLGNLSFVLPPGSDPESGNISGDVLNKYCYQYRYDVRHRLIEKRVPGQDGWTDFIYNQLNQIVFTQDPVQSQASSPGPYRSFIKYDVLGRVIMTGVESGHTSSRAVIQDIVNNHPQTYEQPNNDPGHYHGYTNVSVPAYAPNMDPEVVNYYDSYVITGIPAYTVSGYSSKTKGLLTATKRKVIGSSTYLWTVNCYDDQGRLVKQYKQHFLSGNAADSNYDEITNTYNFAAELLSSTRVHHVGSASTTIVNNYSYDHMGRKQLTKESINGAAEVVLSKLEYNEVGLLLRKSIHSTDGLNYLQNSDYIYNERGWLKKSTSNQFSFELLYQDGTSPQYNGNISGQLWGAAGSNTNNFVYSYDKINRLVNGASTGIVMSEALAYDLMGNITSLTRDGGTPFNFNYSGNRINTVSGGYLATTGTYTYDANGNAIYNGRDSVQLTYNHLNLPVTAIQSARGVNIEYVYDATGQRLRKTSAGTTRNYIDGIEYDGAGIEIIHNDEGVARRNGSSYSYEYNLKDYLGNVRYTFRKNPVSGLLERLQSDDYYPFGLRKSGSPVSLNNKYLFNGKELQDEIGQYDYGARFYDPVIGRFTTVDRYAEKYSHINPYQYGLNNPVLFIDINGDSVHVAESSRAEMNKSLQAIYGDNASKFTYNKNGMLRYSGDTKGFSKEQNGLFKGLSNLMNESTTTNVIFGSSTTITLKDGTTQVINAADGGGAATILVGENNVSQNTILIDPSSSKNGQFSVFAVTDAYYKTPIDPANGARFEQKMIMDNKTADVFHEFGHVINRGKSQDKVLDYENLARKHLGLSPRPYDETHNRTVKKSQYGN